MAKGFEIPQIPPEQQTPLVRQLSELIERLVQRIAEQDEQIGQLKDEVAVRKGERTPWLAGYRVKVLDGNCIEATHHRIEQLRGTAAGALPGKSLVIYEPRLEMATDVFLCEDGHAQERSLLSAVLPTVEPGEILIMDRNFCVRDFLHRFADRQAYFICRQHQGLPWEAAGEERFIGRSESGAIYELWVRVSDSDGTTRRLRRIRIVLKKATRDGDKVLTLLTNLSNTAAHAKHIAWMYRKRWSIETG